MSVDTQECNYYEKHVKEHCLKVHERKWSKQGPYT